MYVICFIRVTEANQRRYRVNEKLPAGQRITYRVGAWENISPSRDACVRTVVANDEINIVKSELVFVRLGRAFYVAEKLIELRDSEASNYRENSFKKFSDFLFDA